MKNTTTWSGVKDKITTSAGLSPELGISVISLAAKAITAMKLLRIDENTTANIGSIHGGESTNVVCDQVEVHMEIRSLEQERAFQEVEEVRACCIEACRQLGGRFELECEVSYEGYLIVSSETKALMPCFLAVNMEKLIALKSG